MEIKAEINYEILDEYLNLLKLDKESYYRDLYIKNLPIVDHIDQGNILLKNVGGLIKNNNSIKVLENTELGVMLNYHHCRGNEIILEPMVKLSNKYPEVIGFYFKNNK